MVLPMAPESAPAVKRTAGLGTKDSKATGLCDNRYPTSGLLLSLLDTASSKQGGCVRLEQRSGVECKGSAWSTFGQQDAVVKQQVAGTAV